MSKAHGESTVSEPMVGTLRIHASHAVSIVPDLERKTTFADLKTPWPDLADLLRQWEGQQVRVTTHDGHQGRRCVLIETVPPCGGTASTTTKTGEGV